MVVYAEFAVVARKAPAELASQIRALPSSRDFQRPYREAFEQIAAFFPLNTDDEQMTVHAKALLVKFLGMAAMNTDCLRRAMAGGPNNEVLSDCMADKPDDR